MSAQELVPGEGAPPAPADGNWHTGNAADDSADYRGWLVGHFIDPQHGTIRQTTDVEVKWGVHAKGHQRPEWVTGERRSTLIILVSGKFRVDLSVTSVTLARQGDYLAWGPDVDHSWQAEEESVVITVRWPSFPGGSAPFDPRNPAGLL